MAHSFCRAGFEAGSKLREVRPCGAAHRRRREADPQGLPTVDLLPQVQLERERVELVLDVGAVEEAIIEEGHDRAACEVLRDAK
eukprot:15482064-Alexandrium_andersonii.AAC.1